MKGWVDVEPPSGFNTEPLDWESSALTTRPLLHEHIKKAHFADRTSLIIVSSANGEFLNRIKLCHLIKFKDKNNKIKKRTLEWSKSFQKIILQLIEYLRLCLSLFFHKWESLYNLLTRYLNTSILQFDPLPKRCKSWFNSNLCNTPISNIFNVLKFLFR